MLHISRINQWGLRVVGCCLLILSLNCSSKKHFAGRPLIADEYYFVNIAQPERNKVNLYEDAIEKIVSQEIDELVNLSWHFRKLTNNHKQAKNINALDEVPRSSWFVNRNHKNPMSLQEIKQGPNRSPGPDLEGPLSIISAKTEGVTPGFSVKDHRGDIYIIKFDPKGYPELATAAEVITTKFVYAAGYNTPENYISRFDPKNIRIVENVFVKNRWGRKVPMTYEFVQKLLEKAEPNPDGSYRIVASKFLTGEVVGPLQYLGVRKDDPNDHIPHQHRRELRGYKVLAAWLNIFDTKAINTLDMYVNKNGKSFVRHYIIDFGSSLGSGGKGPLPPARGHEGSFDLGKILLRLFTLGLWVPPWDKESGIISPSVGYFESKLFAPGDYAFIIPNLAFQKATELDGFWGAKIVMSFTDAQIRAVVETAKYSDPEDDEYIIKTLIERRDKTGRYWYSKVNPLDNFRFTQSENYYRLEFDDLAIRAGFQTSSQTFYRYKLMYRDKDLTGYFSSQGRALIPMGSKDDFSKKNMLSNNSDQPLTFKIETKRGVYGSWGKFVKVHFSFPVGNSRPPQIVAIKREN